MKFTYDFLVPVEVRIVRDSGLMIAYRYRYDEPLHPRIVNHKPPFLHRRHRQQATSSCPSSGECNTNIHQSKLTPLLSIALVSLFALHKKKAVAAHNKSVYRYSSTLQPKGEINIRPTKHFIIIHTKVPTRNDRDDMVQPMDGDTRSNISMNDVPSPSMIFDTNISPNPVVMMNHTSSSSSTTTSTTTKRVEFNFVPSMMMFENEDDVVAAAAAEQHHDYTTKRSDDDPLTSSIADDARPNVHATATTVSGSTTTTMVGGSTSGSSSSDGGAAVLWDTETGTFLCSSSLCVVCAFSFLTNKIPSLWEFAIF